MSDAVHHRELCEKTAKWIYRRMDVVLWEYKSFASSEEPDVLGYRNYLTVLLEIKVSRSDFLSDKKKECRKKSVKNNFYHNVVTRKYHKPYYEVSQAPHLGFNRFYVCPKGLIQPEEVGEWGLIWFNNGKFRAKKDSGVFRRDMNKELHLLTHAFRKKTGLIDCNVMVKSFSLDPQD